MATTRRALEAPSIQDTGSRIGRDLSRIGPGIKIEGEITGTDDLLIDGTVEGTIKLHLHTLTVGHSGQLNCKIEARHVIVHGNVRGNLFASDLIEIKNDATVIGDLKATRVVIEAGAIFKGYIDMDCPEISTPKPIS